MTYFGSFQQVISYLFDPDEIFAANLRRGGRAESDRRVRRRLTDQEHAARQLARPLEQLALYLDDPAAILSPNDAAKRRFARLIAIHPGSGSEAKNWPCGTLDRAGGGASFGDAGRRILLIGGEADEERVGRLAASCLTKKCSVRRIFRWPNWQRLLQNARYSSVTTAAFRISPRPSERHRISAFRSDRSSDLGAGESRTCRVLRSPDLTMAGIEVRGPDVRGGSCGDGESSARSRPTL